MGLAFTVDSPVKVARFGIDSVISIIESNLIEKMRSHYYAFLKEDYLPILSTEQDFRAKRVTDYLNLINRIVKRQVEELRNSRFDQDSELCKYFEMLPETSELKQIYFQMLQSNNPEEKLQLEEWLRKQVVPGSIDVNIMTKLDKNNKDDEGNVIEDGSDAVTALRGFALSDLTQSSVILSAGMNPRLFSYMEKLDAFDANSNGFFKKKIVVKVSDYRSALIQGKMLAKKGLWVSEFRIESGLNCGGHAFASEGYLMGPILDEFRTKKPELASALFEIYNQALENKDKQSFDKAHPIKITVQGGIGTGDEDELLRHHYHVDGTGWGSPFLLVPEATTVDDNTLNLLRTANEKDVVLSKNSPLGIGFNYLKGTSSAIEKQKRIDRGTPGSPCTEKVLVSNTEFGPEPICTASRSYQKKKIDQLKKSDLTKEEYSKQLQNVLDKECLCIGLSNAAIRQYDLKPFKNLPAVNICPGPNIAYFTEILSLKRMVDHIYGRANVINRADRPHMFIKELTLYVDYWKDLLIDARDTVDRKTKSKIQQFYNNLMDGISYYRTLALDIGGDFELLKDKFEDSLDTAEKQVKELMEVFQKDGLATV
jgi:hypothetical protein